jgi:hypothetical protein
MQRGSVCIAGYDRDGNCFRPTLPPPGIMETSLFVDQQPIIFPFAVVEFDLVRPRPQPPHTEDHDYDPSSTRFVRRVRAENRERLLNLSLFESIENIFVQTIHDDWGYYVMDGSGPRSVGTILPRDIAEVRYEEDRTGKWDYRLRFVDGIGRDYRLKITDLTWHYYCHSLRSEERQPAQIALELTQMLHTRKVYLRIGLSRGWAEYPDRCYLQVNGIHTFPDYLEGMTFADLG